jgi:hypothetical protein
MPIIVYIAAPLTTGALLEDGTINLAVYESNIQRAMELGLHVFEAGFVPIIVHASIGRWFGAISEQAAIDADFAIIERCDVLLLGQGWQRSRGCQAEIQHARARHMPVLESVDELKRWAAERVTQTIDLDKMVEGNEP